MIAVALVLSLLGASPELDDGRAAFSTLKFERAVEKLRRAADDASLPTAERVEALDLLARSHVALGQADKARAAWDALLTLDPMAPEPQGSPKVRASFKQAKEAKFPPRYLQVTRRPSGNDVLDLELVNPWALEVRVELWDATEGKDFQKRGELTLSGNRGVMSLQPGTRGYVRVVGADGVLLASLGSATEAFDGPPAPPPPLVKDTPTQTPATTPQQPPARAETAPPAATQPQPVGLTTRKITGIVIGGLGVAVLAVGVGFLATGIDHKVKADGWPLNGISFPQYQQYDGDWLGNALGGGLLGSLGLAGLITGLVLLLSD